MPHRLLIALLLAVSSINSYAAKPVYPEYGEPKAVFDFFFEHPRHISNGLYWIRSFMNPLIDEPYNMAPEFMDIVVVIHGTEIVTLAKHNYEKYRESVERMRYYVSLGVKFKVCGIAAEEFAYRPEDLQDFVDIVPSAMAELVYWQQQGYGMVIPQVHNKLFSNDEIR